MRIGIVASSVQVQESSGDVTPDAVNWGLAEYNGIETVYQKQRITGIDTNISLRVSYSQILNIVYKVSNTDDAYQFTTNPSVYGFVTINDGDIIVIEPNQYLTFASQYIGSPGFAGPVTVTITNTSDGDSIIDTFDAEVGVID